MTKLKPYILNQFKYLGVADSNIISKILDVEISEVENELKELRKEKLIEVSHYVGNKKYFKTCNIK